MLCQHKVPHSVAGQIGLWFQVCSEWVSVCMCVCVGEVSV